MGLRRSYSNTESPMMCPAQAYAFAVLGYQPGERLLSAVAKGVQWQLRDFSPQARCPELLMPASCSGLT